MSKESKFKSLGQRERSGSLDEFIKRKRDEREPEELEAFTCSKKVVRSPQKKAGEGESLKMILSQLAEMNNEIKSLKKSNTLEEIKSELKNIREETQLLRLELVKKEEKWEMERNGLHEEIKALKERMMVMEYKDLQREREKRQNNIIITNGVENADKLNNEQLKAKVEDLCEEKLKIKIKLEKARFLSKNKAGQDVVLATVATFEDKLQVMKNKHRLTAFSEKIFINDDYTKTDREQQAKLRRIAQEERSKGNNVRVGFGRVRINDKWFKIEELVQENKM